MYGHAIELLLKCHVCNHPAHVKSDEDGLLRCARCQRALEAEAEPEKCPWCGEVAPVEVGRIGSTFDDRAYDAWLEAHVMECEPWLREQGEAVNG